MKKSIFYSLLLMSSLHATSPDDQLEKTNHAIIRNYQTLNQSTHAIQSHKQALSEVTSAIYANFNALQKFQILLQEQQDVLKKNIESIDLSSQTMKEHAEAVQESRKILHFFKNLPWVLIILFIFLLIPSLIILWAVLDLKKTLKKK